MHPIQDTIDSLNHSLAQPLRDLLLREHRLQQNKMIIDDVENIEEALRAGINVQQLYFSGENTKLPEALLAELPHHVPIYEITPRTCKKIFNKDRFTRIFAVADLPQSQRLTTHFANTKGDIIVLDELAITGNIGAIIRTATALNAAGVVVLNMEPIDLYDRRIIRSSRGYLFRLPVVTATLDDLSAFCQEEAIDLVSLSAQAEHTIDQVAKQPNRMAFVLGAEKTGCSEAIENLASIKAKIPINPNVESLNVSVAASITLYLRQFLMR